MAVAGYYSDTYTVVAKAKHELGGYIYLGKERHRYCQEGQRVVWAETDYGRTIDSGCWSYDLESGQIRIAWLARAGEPDNFYETAPLTFIGDGPNLHAWIIKEFMKPVHPTRPGLKSTSEEGSS